MKRNIEKEMTLYTLQTPPKWEIFERSMVYIYNRMFKKYFEDSRLIPKGNLIEIKYENFIINPLNEIEKIYKELGIFGFGNSKKRFIKYINSQSKIKTFEYSIDKQLKKKIYNYFKTTIDMWKYDIY
jgi:hypothetical protein